MTFFKNNKNVLTLLHLLLYGVWDHIGGNHEMQIIIPLFSLLNIQLSVDQEFCLWMGKEGKNAGIC